MKHIQIRRTKKSLAKGLYLLLFFGLIGSFEISAAFQNTQQDDTSFNQFKGEVVDQQSKKPLVFATLTIDETNISTVTNTEGEFLLKIPKEISDGNVLVSFLGYRTRIIPLSQLKENKNRILLEVSVTELSEVNISVPRNAVTLVKEMLRRKGENYFDDPTVMTAFYRETIKKRRKNVSLSEAVVNIYKTPYTSPKRDLVELYKARKSTDYSKLDTLALKLQGGPFNALFVDIMKYPEFIFTKESIEDYSFSFDRSTRINDKINLCCQLQTTQWSRYPSVPRQALY